MRPRLTGVWCNTSLMVFVGKPSSLVETRGHSGRLTSKCSNPIARPREAHSTPFRTNCTNWRGMRFFISWFHSLAYWFLLRESCKVVETRTIEVGKLPHDLLTQVYVSDEEEDWYEELGLDDGHIGMYYHQTKLSYICYLFYPISILYGTKLVLSHICGIESWLSRVYGPV